MSDWMVYLTNNYGLDYGHEYETLDCVMHLDTALEETAYFL